jgi:hypothetical protein
MNGMFELYSDLSIGDIDFTQEPIRVRCLTLFSFS